MLVAGFLVFQNTNISSQRWRSIKQSRSKAYGTFLPWTRPIIDSGKIASLVHPELTMFAPLWANLGWLGLAWAGLGNINVNHTSHGLLRSHPGHQLVIESASASKPQGQYLRQRLKMLKLQTHAGEWSTENSLSVNTTVTMESSTVTVNLRSSKIFWQVN